MTRSASPNSRASAARKQLSVAVLARIFSMVLPECSEMIPAMIRLVSGKSAAAPYDCI